MHSKPHPKFERTLVIIKPDGIQRSLIGEIISRFERVGIKLVATKFFVPTEVLAEQHYLLDPEWLRKVGEKSIASYDKKGEVPPSTDPLVLGRNILAGLKTYLVCGPVLAMVWEGAHVVELVRKLVGSTEPRTSDVGTIRGDFVHDSYPMADVDKRSIRNLIHASGSVAEANPEIELWFKKEELVNYRLIQEAITYDINLDGIIE